VIPFPSIYRLGPECYPSFLTFAIPLNAPQGERNRYKGLTEPGLYEKIGLGGSFPEYFYLWHLDLTERQPIYAPDHASQH
jgi:hypothetical protein